MKRLLLCGGSGGLAGQPALVDEAAKGDQGADEKAQRTRAGDQPFAQGIHGDHKKTDEGRAVNRPQSRDEAGQPKAVFERHGDTDEQNECDGFGEGSDAQGFHGRGSFRFEADMQVGLLVALFKHLPAGHNAQTESAAALFARGGNAALLSKSCASLAQNLPFRRVRKGLA